MTMRVGGPFGSGSYAPKITVTVSPIGTSSGKGSNNGCDYGPDTPSTTTVGIQEAINAVVAAGGGRILLRNGTYNLAANTNVGCSTEVAASTPPATYVPLEIVGESALATTPGFSGYPANGVIIVATPGSGTTVGVIDFHNAKVALNIENIAVLQPANAQMWHAFDVSVPTNGPAALLRNCYAGQNTYSATAPTNHGTGATDTFAAGFRGTNNFFGVYENCVAVGYNVGFRGSAQSTYISCGVGYCGSAFYFSGSDGEYDHPLRFYNFTASSCQYVLNNNAAQTAQVTGEISFEYAASGNFAFQSFIYDPSNLLRGDIYVTGHASGGSTPNTSAIPIATLNNNGGALVNLRQVGTYPTGMSYQTGTFYGVATNAVFSTVAMTSGRTTAQPFIVTSARTFNALAINVTVAGGTGSTARLGIYADSGTGVPGTLVLDAGTVATDSTGAKLATISQTLPPGIYWLVVRDIQVTSAPTVTATGSNAAAVLLGGTSIYSSGFNPRSGWFSDTVSSPLPTSFPALTAASNLAAQTVVLLLRAT